MAGVDTSMYQPVQQPSPLDMASKLQGLDVQKQMLDTAKFDLINKQYQAMNGALSTLAADPNLTQDKYIGQINYFAKMGMISPQMAATESSAVYQTGGDPNKLKSLATSHLQQSVQGQGLFNSIYGVTPVNQGPVTTYQRMNMFGPNGQPQMTPVGGGTFANGLSPSESTAPVTVTGPNGQPRTMTRGQFIGATGTPNPNQNALGVGYTPGLGFAQPGGQGVALPPSLGGMPQQPQGPNALGVTPPAPTSSTKAAPPPPPNSGQGSVAQPATPAPQSVSANPPTGSMAAPQPQAGELPGIAGPVPGAVTAQEKTAAASADQGATLQAAADNAPQRKATLSNLEDDLKNFTAGPGSANMRTLKAGVNAASNMVGGPSVFDPKTIAAQENFMKLANQLAAQQSEALGGSVAGLHNAEHANPNTDFSNMGNAQVIQVLKGNEDAISAKNKAWQAWKKQNGPNSYGDFQTQFNQSYEPRAYQFPYMSPQERTELFRNMSPNERAQVQAAIEAAEQNGYIKAPGAK